MDGPLRIHVRDVHAWCLVHGLDSAEVMQDTWRMVRAMDRKLFAMRAESVEEASAPEPEQT